MRSFIAIDLPDGLLDMLERVQEGLPGRLVARENLHLTLAFLGDQTEVALRDLHEALAGLEIEAPALRVTGLDLFGGSRPDLVFADVARDAALNAAHDRVVRAVRAAGIALPRDRFRPHITLARFAKPLGSADQARLGAALGVLEMPAMPATAVTLYRSDLRPEGPRHDALARYPFAGDEVDVD